MTDKLKRIVRTMAVVTAALAAFYAGVDQGVLVSVLNSVKDGSGDQLVHFDAGDAAAIGTALVGLAGAMNKVLQWLDKTRVPSLAVTDEHGLLVDDQDSER